MPPRHQHHITIGHRHGFVQRAILGEDTLEAETLGRVQAMVIGLLKIGHLGEIVLVMPMWRIGRPVARGREDFRHQEAVGDIPVFHGNRVDMPRIGALAALDERNPLRPDPLCLAAGHGGRRADCKHTVGRGLCRPVGTRRHIDAMRRCLLEDRHAVAKLAEILATAGEFSLALDENQHDLRLAGLLRRTLPGLHAIQPEADITPAGGRWRDVMHLAHLPRRLAQQIGHSSSPVFYAQSASDRSASAAILIRSASALASAFFIVWSYMNSNS